MYALCLRLIACIVFFVFKLQIDFGFGVMYELKVKGVLYMVVCLHIFKQI